MTDRVNARTAAIEQVEAATPSLAGGAAHTHMEAARVYAMLEQADAIRELAAAVASLGQGAPARPPFGPL